MHICRSQDLSAETLEIVSVYQESSRLFLSKSLEHSREPSRIGSVFQMGGTKRRRNPPPPPQVGLHLL